MEGEDLPDRSPPQTPRSGFQQSVGYRLVEWSEGLAATQLVIGPQHLNIAGVVHGGVLMSLIDTACGYAGCFGREPDRQQRAVTLSLTTSFLVPVSEGILKAVGRMRFGGRRTFFCEAEVFDGNDTLVAIGQGTFQYRRTAE